MSIFISIIIPTYKPSYYIEECLESINNQNYDHNKFEVIIVVNGDFEYYYEYVNKNTQKYLFDIEARVTYTSIPGVSNARNIGIDTSNGSYICFIDDDDIISSNFLSNLIEKATNESIVVSNVYNFSTIINSTKLDYLSKTFAKGDIRNLFLQRSFLSNACCKLIPKRIIGERRFNPKFKIGEDSLFMFEISNLIKSINLSSKETIYYRRIREDSASRKKKLFTRTIISSTLLLFAYSKIYFKAPREYSLKIYLSRIIAIFKNLIR